MQKTANEDLSRLSIAAFKTIEKHPIVVVLDNIRSMHNVGSVFRTADAFLVERIFLCGYTPTPPHKDIYKTALGATESVDWNYCATTLEAIEQLRKADYQIYAIEQASPKLFLQDFKPRLKSAFVFGSEVGGVEEQVLAACDACIEIPQWGTKHSINISVAVGVVLWDVVAKLKQKH
jgi:tRNA G18 (ribose-2'-O)-methylase SpoU